MSPEQVRGEELDGRSDVFGLGVVLFEMITGRRLFSADSEIEEMKMILSAPIPRPSALVPVIPEPLSDIVLRALARERADRWASGKDLARALSTQCQSLLYDQEARSMFMREHFADQMSATAALLQSVSDSSAKHMVLAKAVKAIRGDGGAMSNAQRMSKEEVKIAKAKPRKKDKKAKDDDTNEQLIALAAQAEALGASGNAVGPRTNPNASRGVSWVVPGILLVAMLMLGGALFKVTFTNEPPPPTTPFYDKPVPIPHGPEDDASPQTGQNNPSKDAPSKDDPKKDKPPPARTGTVTIITFPDATVFRGKTQIGQTPLFNAALPVGTQLLTLVGADGVKHVLSVPVRDGKNSPIKVKLDELPAR
jgi:serine/threonine-protein kinase